MKEFLNSKAGIGVLVAFSFGLLIGIIMLIRYFIKLGKLPKDTTYQPVIDQQGNVVETDDPLQGWDPMPMVSELETVLKTSYWADASPRCGAYKKAHGLSDNQLIAVANKYKNRNTKTVRAAMEETYSDGCWSFDSAFGELLRARMTTLGIP